MRIKNKYILFTINILTLILILIIILLHNIVLRIIFGLPILLFYPGFTFLGALFPNNIHLDGINRIVFSFGLSLAIGPLIGLSLNYTPWGIRLLPILISLFIFILTMSIIALYREKAFSEEQKISLSIKYKFTSLVFLWRAQTKYQKFFTTLIIVIILASISATVYILNLPKYGTPYTEFYFTNKIPSTYTAIVGQNTSVSLSIINHESKTNTYRLEISINGSRVKEIDNITLANNENWEQSVNFAPISPGTNEKTEFFLYNSSGTEIYRRLTLWINIFEIK